MEAVAVAFSGVGLRRRSKACPAMSGRVGCWRHPVVSRTGARAVLAALEPGRTSWMLPLDASGLAPSMTRPR
jgi:hypothetical protein